MHSFKAAQQGDQHWLDQVCPRAFALVFQNLLVEENSDIRAKSNSAWNKLIAALPPRVLGMLPSCFYFIDIHTN
jgi:hypothetical protein